jgi:hypothetical protein
MSTIRDFWQVGGLIAEGAVTSKATEMFIPTSIPVPEVIVFAFTNTRKLNFNSNAILFSDPM